MALIDHNIEAREDWRPGVATRMRISAMNGAKALTVFEQWCKPGLGAPTHWHPVEEVLSVLSGNAEIWVDGETFQASAGHSALIPATSRHGFRNAGVGELHIMAILASPGFEANYEDRSEISRRWWRESGE